MSIKTPEDIGEFYAAGIATYDNGDIVGTRQDIADLIADAIDADRWLLIRFPYQVITDDGFSVVIGTYRSKFEADAIAKEWNRINNKHGIRYRVEVDA